MEESSKLVSEGDDFSLKVKRVKSWWVLPDRNSARERRLLEGRELSVFRTIPTFSTLYLCLLLVLQEYAKDDKHLLQDPQLFTTGFVEKNSTASLFPLQSQDCEIIAAAKELRLLLEKKNSRVCMRCTGRTWVTG